jgi:cyclohexadieny/prephenate dehydrogenase
MKIATLTVVGVGLIGGSIGLAARKRGIAERILGVGRNKTTLERAQSLGAIDAGVGDLNEAVHQADVAVFCTPVDRIAEQILASAPGCRPGTLLTDAGSTKGRIVAAVEDRLPAGVSYVGSHPLAGSEKRGPENADADLLQDRLVVITRTPRTDVAALERIAAFWKSLGARVCVMAPDEHDAALALTSHLPHLAAAALAGILSPHLHALTATGFRDTTRVAAGDPELWSAIFSQNRPALLEMLGLLETRLTEFKNALLEEGEKTIRALLDQAKRNRDALGS